MKKQFIRLLLFSFLLLFVFYSCQRENKSVPTKEENLNGLAARISQNRDFQKMVGELSTIKKEYSRIFSPLLNSKKKINEIPEEERKLLFQQLRASETEKAFRLERMNIGKAFPEIKKLSRGDLKSVFKQAMSDTRQFLKIKRSFGSTLRSTDDCVEDCYYTYADEYDVCDLDATIELILCEADYEDCVEICGTMTPSQRVECMNLCDDIKDVCFSIVAINWLNCFKGIDDMIDQCIQQCPIES